MHMRMGEFLKGLGLFAYYLTIPWGILIAGSWYCALPNISQEKASDTSKVQLKLVVTATRTIPSHDKISEDDIEISWKRLKSEPGEIIQFPGKVIGRTVSTPINKGKEIPASSVGPIPIQAEEMVGSSRGDEKKLGAIVISSTSIAALLPGMEVRIVKVREGAEKIKIAEGCEQELASPVTIIGLIALSDNDKKAALLFDRTRISDRCFESFNMGQHIPITAR